MATKSRINQLRNKARREKYQAKQNYKKRFPFKAASNMIQPDLASAFNAAGKQIKENIDLNATTRQPTNEVPMTTAQERHLVHLNERFVLLNSTKYRKGQAKHGGDTEHGNLFECTVVALIDKAIDEAIDQVNYLLTLKDRVI